MSWGRGDGGGGWFGVMGLTLTWTRDCGRYNHYVHRNFYYFKPLPVKTDWEQSISVYKYDIFIPKIVFTVKLLVFEISNSNKEDQLFGHSIHAWFDKINQQGKQLCTHEDLCRGIEVIRISSRKTIHFKVMKSINSNFLSWKLGKYYLWCFKWTHFGYFIWSNSVELTVRTLTITTTADEKIVPDLHIFWVNWLMNYFTF